MTPDLERALWTGQVGYSQLGALRKAAHRSPSVVWLGVPSQIPDHCCSGYLRLSRDQARNGNGTQTEAIRPGLLAIADSQLSGVERDIWKTLIEGYSGLADLSVPAWLFAGLMVRSGGRFALVVPATWRSRDYADVIRYLLLRCFSLEVIVEDKLEATHLRQMLVPRLTENTKVELDAAGKKLTRDALNVQAQIDTIVLRAILSDGVTGSAVPKLAGVMTEQADMMRRLRQRVAS